MASTELRAAAQQALEALDGGGDSWQRVGPAIDALKAALAEPTVKESLQVESAFAENATTQQQLEEAPPSDYRRGYWDGFEIGKREGRIEAENALAEPQEPVRLQCVTCGTVYADGVPPQVPAQEPDPTYKRIGCIQHDCEECQRRTQRKPLTVERLRDALVASRIVPPAAVEDPDGYDDGVTLHRIEALHRRLA